jgi:hypothetical protein
VRARVGPRPVYSRSVWTAAREICAWGCRRVGGLPLGASSPRSSVGWETTRRVEEALETPQAATSKVARIGNGGIRSESSGLERTRRVRGQLVRDARELPAPTVGQGREPLHKLWLSLSLLKARAVSQEVARSSRAPPILLLARSESATNPDECLRLWQAATARP